MKEFQLGLQLCRVDDNKRLYLDGEYIGCTPREIPVYLVMHRTEGENIPQDDISALKRGDIVQTSGYDLYLNYVYNGDEEALLDDTTGTDRRTRDYFASLRAKTGYLHAEHKLNEEFEVDISDASFTPAFENDELVVGTVDDAFCAQISGKSASADFYRIRYFFDRRPSVRDVALVRDIEKLEDSFRHGTKKRTFSCWKCGKTVHWLDVPGSFAEKLSAMEKNWCGC